MTSVLGIHVTPFAHMALKKMDITDCLPINIATKLRVKTRLLEIVEIIKSLGDNRFLSTAICPLAVEVGGG